MAITFDLISRTVGQAMETRETQLAQFTQTMDPNSTMDLVKMQHMVQQWTMLTQLNSTLIKELGDTLKGVIQKAA